MNSKISFIVLILLFFSFDLSADDIDHNRAKFLRDSGNIMSLENILKLAEGIQTGRILEVELEQEGNRLIYEIELLNSRGEVLEMLFDARTGMHLSTEYED